jgi:hypothetical protein
MDRRDVNSQLKDARQLAMDFHRAFLLGRYFSASGPIWSPLSEAQKAQSYRLSAVLMTIYNVQRP